ncbi:hypothetical protein [Streptomyces sp. NPDC059928]|uniref:hypothetical protein n=1 Tax=unclassified Streptomyces TaxID=2593676 RepID=UPI00364ED986
MRSTIHSDCEPVGPLLFTQGNQAAMSLLFATSAIALCVIGALGLRRTKAPEPDPAPAAAQPLHSERR